jgi:hypothetical protein
VLVSHRFVPSDQQVLQRLGFDYKTSIIGIVDAHQVARAIVKHPGADNLHSLRLGNVLESLNCPVHACPIAGNDANYALRTLLLLTAEGYSKGLFDNQVRERVENIKSIGQSPIPVLKPQA